MALLSFSFLLGQRKSRIEMSYRLREATTQDIDQIRVLLPRLASFDLPKRRKPEHLWRGDEEMMLRWVDGREPTLHAWVAAEDEAVLGVVVIRMGEELLSHEPSAHLEILAVAHGAEGRGIGKALVTAAEHGARDNGARSMTLHVFGLNTRAREVYEKLGFEGELLRYIKDL